jgi:hypothetical protein
LLRGVLPVSTALWLCVLLQLLINMVLHQDMVLDQIQQPAAAAAPYQQQQQQQSRDAGVPQLDINNRSSSSSMLHSAGVAAAAAADADASSAVSGPEAIGRAAAAAQAGTKCIRDSSAGDACSSSYVTRLLRNATMEQLQLVKAWGVDEWCNYWRVRHEIQVLHSYTVLCHVTFAVGHQADCIRRADKKQVH